MESHSCSEGFEIVEDNLVICSECGQILNETMVTTTNTIYHGAPRRQYRASGTYDILPEFVSPKVRSLTVDIYREVTNEQIFRTNSKKSIMAACFHRASALLDHEISFTDILDIFGLKRNEMNKGFNRLVTALPKNSEYTIPFDTHRDEELVIISLLKTLNMPSLIGVTSKLFKLVKKHTNLNNESFCNSVASGCIYFWIKNRNIPKFETNVNWTVKDISQALGIAYMTILNKYIVIYGMILRLVMKPFFSSLLRHCYVKPTAHRFKSVFTTQPNNTLYIPNKYFIYNAFDPRLIKVVRIDDDKNELPLDDVDNICEWNVLLNTRIYSQNSIYYLHTTLTKNTRNYKFNFEKYIVFNNIDPSTLLANEISALFEDVDKSKTEARQTEARQSA